MGPLCVDLVDVTTERIHLFPHVDNTALGRCLSPLAAALLRGSLSIARFLANKWFLAKADLVGCELLVILRAVLDNASKFDSVEFLDEYTSQPMSLLQMSFVVVSSQLGKGGGGVARLRGESEENSTPWHLTGQAALQNGEFSNGIKGFFGAAV